jgi:hypothetical protein
VIVTIVPAGRGNWKKVELVIEALADLFPHVRDGQVSLGDRWFIADRWWRVVEVLP